MSQYLIVGLGGLVMLGLKFGEVCLRWWARRLGVPAEEVSTPAP